MSKPLVSAIIPNYNYAKYLSDSIESVLAQTYPNVEIIVVDDGSGDDSKAVIDSYGDKITAIYQKNQGVSAARNNGVAAAKGVYLAFLDADDIWLPTKLERQVEMFGADPELGLAHVGLVEFDDSGTRLNESTEGMSGSVAGELLRFERPVILGGGSGAMVSRRAFELAGGFDGRMSTSADWDFFYRVCSRSKAGFVNEILLKYRVHGSNMHANIKAMEHDMMLGYRKAFENGAVENRNACYGNLHKVLAGSYFHAGQYADFVRHAVKSVWRRPRNLGYFLQFPMRRLRRK